MYFIIRMLRHLKNLIIRLVLIWHVLAYSVSTRLGWQINSKDQNISFIIWTRKTVQILFQKGLNIRKTDNGSLCSKNLFLVKRYIPLKTLLKMYTIKKFSRIFYWKRSPSFTIIRICFCCISSFNLCQLFYNQVVKVSKKGWHSLKYCVNIVIICVNMVILCINKR